jgi:hypothetical protein
LQATIREASATYRADKSERRFDDLIEHLPLSGQIKAAFSIAAMPEMDFERCRSVLKRARHFRINQPSQKVLADRA